MRRKSFYGRGELHPESCEFDETSALTSSRRFSDSEMDDKAGLAGTQLGQHTSATGTRHAPRQALRTLNKSKLHRPSGPLVRCWLPLGIVYGLAAWALRYFFKFWPYNGRRSIDGDLVVPIWHEDVNPLYSLLAMLAISAPAAIVFRRISVEFGLLQPFIAASRKPVTLRELEKMTRPGLSSAFVLWRYAPLAAVLQVALLVSSAFVVPLGALMVHTGTWTTRGWNNAQIGAPTSTWLSGELQSLPLPLIRWPAGVIDQTEMVFLGAALSRSKLSHPMPGRIFPLLQQEDAYIDGAEYRDLLSFTWSANCKYANALGLTRCDRTEPDQCVAYEQGHGIPSENMLPIISYRYHEFMTVLFDPCNRTTYFATRGWSRNLAQDENMDPDRVIMREESGSEKWYSRVACDPKLEWHISKCTWNAAVHDFVDCEDEESRPKNERINMTGLEMLDELLAVLPLDFFHNAENNLDVLARALDLGWDEYNDAASDRLQHHIPTLADYEKLYYNLVTSLIRVVTSGHYGYSKVNILLSTPRAVYVVRKSVLNALVKILLWPPMLCIGVLWWNHMHRVIYRRVGFWELVMAIRGKGWEERLLGSGFFWKTGRTATARWHCRELASQEELLENFGHLKVRFGVDKETGAVGLVELDRWLDLDDSDLYI
jgi:hypothetical protein